MLSNANFTRNQSIETMNFVLFLFLLGGMDVNFRQTFPGVIIYLFAKCEMNSIVRYYTHGLSNEEHEKRKKFRKKKWKLLRRIDGKNTTQMKQTISRK